MPWLTCGLFSYSGTRIEQSFWSSWTRPCDATVNTTPVGRARTLQQISGKKKGKVVFWERNDDCELIGHRAAAARWLEGRRRCFRRQSEGHSHHRLVTWALLTLSSEGKNLARGHLPAAGFTDILVVWTCRVFRKRTPSLESQHTIWEKYWIQSDNNWCRREKRRLGSSCVFLVWSWLPTVQLGRSLTCAVVLMANVALSLVWQRQGACRRVIKSHPQIFVKNFIYFYLQPRRLHPPPPPKKRFKYRLCSSSFFLLSLFPPQVIQVKLLTFRKARTLLLESQCLLKL